MIIEIDQSGKVEDTSIDTVIGAANGFRASLRFSAREKKRLQKLLREIGKQTLFPCAVFAVLVFLVIRKKTVANNEISIDEEYTGREAQIKLHLVRLMKTFHPRRRQPYISFDRIGRKSPAHEIAINTYRKHKKPNYTVTAKEVIKLLLVQ